MRPPAIALALTLGFASGVVPVDVCAGNPKQSPLAKPDSPPADVATDLARRGVDAINRRDFDTACRLLRRSLELHASVKVLLNLAVAELNAGRALEAAEHFRAYTMAPDAVPDRVETVREELLPKAYAEIGRLVFDVPDGTSVRFNDKPMTVHPGEDHAILVAPGPVHLELPDGRFVNTTVEKGQVHHIVFPQMPSTPKAASAPLASDKGGTSAASTAGGAATAGTATAANRGAEGGDAENPTPSSAGWGAKTWVLLGGAIATAACAAGGIGFTLQASSDDDKASRLRDGLLTSGCINPATPDLKQQCDSLQDSLLQAGRDRNAATGFFVGAGVLGAATIATWILWPSAVPSAGSGTRSAAPIALTWLGTADRWGMSVRGTF